MTTQFSVDELQLELFRYPPKQEANLQAWDAADEYLVKQLIEREEAPLPCAIINDSFGSLTASLTKLDAQRKLFVETDAKTSQLGTSQNLERNGLSSDHIQWFHSRELLPVATQQVLMKLPKNLNYFADQLIRLSQVLPEGTPVYIGAKAKSINKALLSLIAQNLGPASASLAWKKSRMITCISDGIKRPIAQASSWKVPEYALTLSNLSNVFAATKLDIGARFMLDNLPQGEFDTIVDLGCGNGVLGLRAKQCYPKAHIHFVDDSEMAIASAKANWQLNQLDEAHLDAPQASFHWDDCLTHLGENVQPDLILCNPPFHQGEAITDHIAWQMFLDSFRQLKLGGILHVVGNRHLAYHVKLKRIFKNCTTIAANGKFVILQAQKLPK
ncbi:methyltransferase [Shewanella sp. AS1]|uniref:methyltransferase n=1 Tax=Shewanella sp. AS1 TaxID=2907626 RepID=UPI001F3DBCC9|nr:methyltransferase [Shewanella sp. AS1]MCE9677958.1 methyltransferase [Shewanella sp. AS1]